jgi:transcriptional regulator with XRE-family HTH domain
MEEEFKTMRRNIGRIIGDARKSKGISQEELAHRADIDRTYVSQIERGIGNPSLFIVYRVAHALELSLAKLFQQY